MKHCFSLFVLVFVLFSDLIAQDIKISGVLIEKENGEPVPYANVLLVNDKDSVLVGALSNLKGEFQMTVVSQKNLMLRTSGLGYKEQEMPIVLTGEKSQKVESIAMEKDVALLGEVSVGAQNTVVQKFDRKVYSMNENRKAAAKDIYDLLRTLPGVVVDEQKNVRYKGTEASILVDDMPAQYMYPDLEMIPVASVDKIELIDAAMQTGEIGKGGIINIRMKTVREDGLSGVANARGSLEGRKPYNLNSWNSYLNMNLKQGKWVVFNNFYSMKGSWGNETLNNGSVEYAGDIFESTNYRDGRYEYKYFSDYLGVQYDFSKNTKLVIAAGLNGNAVNNESHYDYNQTFDLSQYRAYSMDYFASEKQMSGNGYVFFRHAFDTTLRELKGWVSLNLPNFLYQNDNSTIYRYSTIASNPVDSMYATYIDKLERMGGIYSGWYYNHPMGEKARWNVNYRLSANYMPDGTEDFYENNLIVKQQSDSESGFKIDNTLSFRMGTTVGKWKLDGGIRAEQEHIDYRIMSWMDDGNDTTTNIVKNYLSILPSATIVFSVDSLQDMKLSYSRSARTPWYAQLNPMLYKRSPVSWEQGNPDLDAVVFDNLYFGYALNKPMWNLSADLFYSLTSNEVAYLQYPLSESLSLSMPDNYAYKSRFGIDLSGFYSIKGMVNLSLSGSMYHSTINSGTLSDALASLGVTPEDVVKKNYGYDIKLTTNVSFSQNTSAMMYVSYNSREYSLSGYQSDRISSSMSFTQRFFNRRLTASLGVSNIFNDFLPRESYHNYMGSVSYTETLYSTQMQRMLFLSINYRFNKGDRNTGGVGQEN